MRVMTRTGSSGYSWVRWEVAGGKSNWHQLSEHFLRRVLGLRMGALLRVVRLQTRCGLDVFDVRHAAVPGRKRDVPFIVRPRRKGSAEAPAAR